MLVLVVCVVEIEDKVVAVVLCARVFSCLVINWLVDCAVGKVLLKVVERVVGGFEVVLVVWDRVVPEVVERGTGAVVLLKVVKRTVDCNIVVPEWLNEVQYFRRWLIG